jgi:hypothetical protein
MFFDVLTETVALVVKAVPPKPELLTPPPVAVVVKGPTFTPGRFALLLMVVGPLELGITQEPKVSEKAEAEMANPVVTASRNFFIKRELLFISI